jgi:hypothetical protein
MWLYRCFLFFSSIFLTTQSQSIPVKDNCNVLSIGIGGSYSPIYIAMLEKYRLEKYDLYAGISIGGSFSGTLSFFNGNITEGIDFLKKHLTFNKDFTHRRYIKYQSITEMYRRKSFLNNEFPEMHHYIYETLKKTKKTETPQIHVPSLVGAVHKSTNQFHIFDLSKYNETIQLELFLSTISIKYFYPSTKLSIYNQGINNEFIDGGTSKAFIIEQIEQYIDCQFYNITLFTILQLHPMSSKSYSFKTSIFHLSINQYLYLHYSLLFYYQIIVELDQFCPIKVKGHLHLCYVNTTKLSHYSPLDFRHNDELYEIGLKHTNCKTYNYCGK